MNIKDLVWFDCSRLYIRGRWTTSKSQQNITVDNPSTGEHLAKIASGSAVDIDAAVTAARQSLAGEWGKQTAVQRGRLLTRMGQIVSEKIDQLASIESLDVGKPLSQSRADAVTLARYLEYYGGCADKIHGETLPYLDGYTVYTLREPHGVTGHIIPWNYPMQIIGRSVAAALAMGNAVVLKPAEDACLTALAFAAIADEAGLPEGALNVVPGLGNIAGRALSEHTGIQHLSFTGSVATGSAIQSAAASNVVPVTLELGGKSPQLIFEDADIDAAIPFLVNAGIQNAGQTCSASSRLLVQRGVLEQVIDQLAERYRALKCGAATDDLDLGPLISEIQKERVMAYLDQDAGLELIATGCIDESAPVGGYYVEPRLYLCNDPRHVLAQREIFGPVQLVIPFDTEAEAVEIANGTDFGLVASVWTSNGGRQMRLAKQLEAGQVFINNYGAGGGVELPFGGVGKSGHGREKGFEALYGFSRLKTVATLHG